MLPALSIVAQRGLEPVGPKMVDVPFGVILETLFELALAVYMLPSLSMAIPYGYPPVDPRIVDVPFGVIFETLFAPVLVV